MVTVDLSIVGNGILGLMTAFELTNKDPSLKIVVIGPSDQKGGASQASGAMLGCFGEITDQTFVNDQAEKRFMMAYDAHKRWQSVIEKLNSGPQRAPARNQPRHFRCNEPMLWAN